VWVKAGLILSPKNEFATSSVEERPSMRQRVFRVELLSQALDSGPHPNERDSRATVLDKKPCLHELAPRHDFLAHGFDSNDRRVLPGGSRITLDPPTSRPGCQREQAVDLADAVNRMFE
jgi:hypothetical protein